MHTSKTAQNGTVNLVVEHIVTTPFFPYLLNIYKN